MTIVTSLETAKQFLNEEIAYLGGGFNPDTPFEDYVDTRSGEKLYNKRNAVLMNKNMTKAVDFFEQAGEDIHEYCLNQAASKDIVLPDLKMERLNKESAEKRFDDHDIWQESPLYGYPIAVWAVKTTSEEFPELFITEYDKGVFWTIGHNQNIVGTITECLDFLINRFI